MPDSRFPSHRTGGFFGPVYSLIRNLTAEHVYLACGRTDMRKSIDGLAALVLSKFQLDPHQPALFLFCDRRKDRIKGLL